MKRESAAAVLALVSLSGCLVLPFPHRREPEVKGVLYVRAGEPAAGVPVRCAPRVQDGCSEDPEATQTDVQGAFACDSSWSLFAKITPRAGYSTGHWAICFFPLPERDPRPKLNPSIREFGPAIYEQRGSMDKPGSVASRVELSCYLDRMGQACDVERAEP